MPWPQPVVLVRFGGLRLQVREAVARIDRASVAFPVDLHRDDVLDRVHEPLVAQVADGERFRRAAERHQREELLLVDVDRERMLAGDGTSRVSPFSSIDGTLKVAGRAASVRTGR